MARIVKTQGRRGEVAAEILTDFPERLARRTEVFLWDGAGEPRPVRVERAWPHKHYLVFQFAGCATVAQAKELVGLEIQIPRAEAAPLGPSLFYEYDLIGCRVVKLAPTQEGGGCELGRVRALVSTGATPLLAVETPGGGELLIPFAEEFCRRVAPAEKIIEVILPEGLHGLND